MILLPVEFRIVGWKSDSLGQAHVAPENINSRKL